MPKFQISEVLSELASKAARLGAGTGAGNNVDTKEANKFVKLVADSRFDLCAVGDKIEGFIDSVEPATLDGYSIGSVRADGRKAVMLEGSQAAGTGAIAVGDFVVAGTPVVKGTAVDTPKVRKATNQPGSVPADLTAAGDQIKVAMYGWRVVALTTLAGTGAVGELAIIERVGAP